VGLTAPLLVAAGILAAPLEMETARLSPPSLAHPLGTDEYGRDVLSRLAHGARPAILVAVVAGLVALALGVPFGALAGLRGGWWDLILTRLMEATGSLPALPLILLIVSFTFGRAEGTSALVFLAAAIGATRWAAIARYVRGGIWKARVEEHTLAAIAMGARWRRILALHLLPAALAPALVSAAFGSGAAVILESTLSYFGLGAQPPAPSWGAMVAGAAMEPGAWWLLVAPGVAIAILVASLNAVAEGVRRRLAGEGMPASPRGAETGGP
jgi:peptide/nickel transport system permease protein